MIKSTKSSSKGFTMVEILIVILTIAVFGSITTLMLANATRIYSSSLKKQKLITESRSTFFKMLREASWQKSYSSFIGSDNKKLIILPGDGNDITYELRSSNDLTQINEQINGNSVLIINKSIDYGNSLFTYKNSYDNPINIENQTADIYSVDLTLKFNHENQNLLFHSKVMPYNFRIGRAMSYHE
tara:strand:+ start:925 stop:1482 length:558 start_codon:yes stop_codon:yes gene_type:complete